jgi:hypothetical protein
MQQRIKSATQNSYATILLQPCVNEKPAINLSSGDLAVTEGLEPNPRLP